jgi:site-specific recombinase XerD
LERLIQLSTLVELSNKEEITDMDQRIIIMYYILYNTGMMVREVITAVINDQEMFKQNLELAKGYFKTFIIE